MWRKTLLATLAALVLVVGTLSTVTTHAAISNSTVCTIKCFSKVKNCELQCLAEDSLPNLELCEAVCQELLDGCIANCAET